MSFKAVRLAKSVAVEAYDWGGWTPDQPAARQAPAASAPPPPPTMPSVDRAAIERDAFAQGFAQGERSGAEAAAARSEAVLQRLKQTIGELQTLRAEMIHKTERQVVQLSIAMAKRIVHREISLDPELLSAMARVALDRLGDAASATIRLHPDDYAATAGAGGGARADASVVRVVADPIVRRGGCLVQSEFGLIDVSADAQIQELATALLGSDESQHQMVAEASLVG
ncbi:MAG: FliH/SctL family protein [Vicinamibacterales bacterium]